MSYQRFVAGLAVGSSGGFGLAWLNLSGSKYEVDTIAPNKLPVQYQNRFKEIMRYGTPVDKPEISVFENHALLYNTERRTPQWVAEHLTKDNITKGEGVNRKKSKFIADLSLPSQFQSSTDDYRKSGWSRGHMAPAADCRISQSAMDQTFLLSNIVPQDRDNNEKYWASIESFCRGLTKRFDDVYVLSGPLYLPNEPTEDGVRYVQYQVIGKSNVAVPTHLYKVVLAVRGDEAPTLGAFIVPNKPIRQREPLVNYQVRLEELENLTGHVFFPTLDRAKVRNLCLVHQCKLISYESRRLEEVRKQLSKAKTLREAEAIWRSIEGKVEPDPETTKEYSRVKQTLSEE